MNPRALANAKRLRRDGVSDATIGRRMRPPVTKQAVHQALGPRTRTAPARREPAPAGPTRAEFAAALHAWRTRRGLSQAGAARLLRVTPHSIASWEVCRCNCALAASMILLMEALDKLDRIV
jgi:DNA-binding XRE family transcriptional regulator